jgi:hypothetical protein
VPFIPDGESNVAARQADIGEHPIVYSFQRRNGDAFGLDAL